MYLNMQNLKNKLLRKHIKEEFPILIQMKIDYNQKRQQKFKFQVLVEETEKHLNALQQRSLTRQKEMWYGVTKWTLSRRERGINRRWLTRTLGHPKRTPLVCTNQLDPAISDPGHQEARNSINPMFGFSCASCDDGMFLHIIAFHTSEAFKQLQDGWLGIMSQCLFL